MSQLGELIKAAQAPVWSQASEELNLLFKQAEDNTYEYSRLLINDPNLVMDAINANVRQRRAQEMANAVALFIQSKKDIESEAIAGAIGVYLRANANASMISGTMYNQGGNVVGVGFVTRIEYPG